MPGDRTRKTDASMDVAQLAGQTGGAARATQGQETGGFRRPANLNGDMG